jgi:hypothetical protein
VQFRIVAQGEPFEALNLRSALLKARTAVFEATATCAAEKWKRDSIALPSLGIVIKRVDLLDAAEGGKTGH